jgi:hypothetical protein
MKHELRTLSFYCSELDNGNICPACPKVCLRLRMKSATANLQSFRLVVLKLFH